MRVLRSLIALSLILGLAIGAPIAAWAEGGGGSSGSTTNTNTNTNSNTNTNTLSNTQSQGNTNTFNPTNVNSQSQGQGQDQKQKQKQQQQQGQKQGQVNQPNQTIEGDRTEIPRQAPPALAPGLVASPETCMGAAAVGASTPFGGVSFGTTYKSEDCELRMFARTLQALGQNAAALALIAQNDNVAKALLAAGVVIPGQKKAEAPAVVAPTSAGSPAVVKPAVATEPGTKELPYCGDGKPAVLKTSGFYSCWR